MKRGVRRAYFDVNKSLVESYKKNDVQLVVDKKRRPSRIEERIRMRKLRINNIKRIKSPESLNKSSNKNGDDYTNSRDSSCAKTNSINSTKSCSSISSENCNFSKIRDSKQRVDLLELHASNCPSINHILSKKPKGRYKINGEKLIGSLFLGRSNIIRTRAKSAPCTPLFQIKYAKDNLSSNFLGSKNFIDYKIVEKDCIDLTTDKETLNINDEVINEKPIGNPALISVMTESLDKMKENLKSGKSCQEIDNEDRDDCNHGRKLSGFNLNLDSANEPDRNTIIDEIEQKSAPREPEIPVKQSASLELRISTNFEDEESNFESRDDRVSKEPLEKCQNCKMEKNRLNSPRNLVGTETADRYILHQPRLDVNFIEDQRTESSCRSRDLQLLLNKAGDCCLRGCNNICKNEINDFGRIQTSNADSNGYRKSTCCSNSVRYYSRTLSALNKCKTGKKFWFDQKPVCPCKTDAAKFNRRSNIESESEIRYGEDRSAVSIENRDSPSLKFDQSRKIVTKCSSSSASTFRAGMRSCDYCNRTAAKCCRKVFPPRSKSSPRRVTFCLPSLIPEELEDSCSVGVEDKTSENYSRICKCGSTGCPGVSELDQNSGKLKKNELSNSVLQESKKSGRISRCKFHSHNCSGCKFNHKSKSPRVHFCREIVNKHQDIVRGDFNDIEEESKLKLPKDSESKTSITSAKEWAVADSVEENLNYLNNVSFPKETRQAMNVLLQSRPGNVTTQLIHEEENSRVSIPGQQPHREQLPLREVELLKKPDLGIFDSAGHKAMHVAKYAQALAVFQRKCDPLQELGAKGSCKKKRHRNIIVRKGISDGEIHSEYTGCSRASEFDLQKIVKRLNHSQIRNNQYLNFLRNKLDPADLNNDNNRTLNVPNQPTGLKMQTNGSDNGSSENGVDRTGWTVGLINGRFKYLTAETFGFKINANGASLKKKQLWTLEGSEHQVFLRSHLDRYLAVDQFGNVTCEAEDTADPGCAFQIQVASDGSGRWALKNIQRGYFLGSSQDELKCTAKVPGDAEYWLVHLAARPQVNLRSAGRKRFAHLSAAQDEIHVDAPVPWGEDTLFTLEFRPAAMPDNVDGNADARRDVRSEAGIGGHYALHTCNNKYLARDGKLLDSCTRDCLYAAEFHAGMLALRDVSGAYLAPIGSKAVLKSRSNTVTRDELFSLEDSLPQASFVAALNQRYVSVKQGVDVTANQDEISGHETFQLEFDRATKRWYLRTMQDRYWTLEAGGGIQASDHKRSSNALFDLVWQPADGTVALRANNGKFLATKRSGHLYANADSPGDSEASKFYFYLMNRPVLVLRCEQGFVGLKSNASPKLECNKASYETIRVERCDRGIVRFKGQNGKYWHADSEGVTSDADVPSDGFYLELREPSRICIKSTDGRYLSAGKNGVFRLGDTDYESATKWEF